MTGVSLCESSKNSFSYRTPPVAASVNRKFFLVFEKRPFPPPSYSYSPVVTRKCRIPLLTKFTIMILKTGVFSVSTILL